MRKKVLFSIVIPNYNCSTFLPKCLDSIIGQTYSDFEVIIVNDGSTDDSINVIKKYSEIDKRIKYIDQPNVGGIISRKNGIEKSNGEYILLMDSDDWIEYDTLEKLSLYLKKYNNPDLIKYRYIFEPSKKESMCFFDSENILFDGSKIKQIWKLLIYTDEYNTIWNCIFKKHLFDFNDEIYNKIVHKGEDLQINIQLMKKIDRVLVINDIFYHYRSNPNGITQKVSPKKMVNNCIDLYYLTKLRKLFCKKYFDDNFEVLYNNYSSTIISQLVKLLRYPKIKKVDLYNVEKELEKTKVYSYINNSNNKSIKYRGSNVLYNIILNNMLNNVKNHKMTRNYKYKFLFELYYRINTNN